MKDPKEYEKYLLKGKPELAANVDSIVDVFYYQLSSLIVEEGKLNALIFICILIIVFIFLKNITRYFAQFFLANVRNGVVRDLRNDLYKKTLELPISYYNNERKGDVMSRMTTDVHDIEWAIMSSLEMLFRDPINIILVLATLLFMSAKLTLVVFILLPVPGFVIGKIASSLKKSSFNAKEKLGLLFSILEETLSGMRIIKGFNAEQFTQNRFDKLNQEYTDIQIKTYRKNDLASPLSEFLGVAVLVVLIYVGGKMVIDEDLKASLFITFIAMFSQILAPAKALTIAWYNAQKGVASIERIEKIFNSDVVIYESEGAKPIDSFQKQIKYEGVSFSYKKGDSGWVLKDINLVIPKGKTIALVGQSGSGKTTMADMLPRFYDCDKGNLSIDGVSVKDLKIKDLRSLLGIVTQESILFNDTVFNNIAFGIPGVSKEQVINAAKIANAHDFIMKMDGTYDANIGDRGGKLSGGQRQRISIARAVLKNPPILILDEATSALDTESEKLVQDALDNLMRNRTSIIIAHRLSTIMHADEIVVLQQGEIVERGTHQELLLHNGTYKKLYDMQSFTA